MTPQCQDKMFYISAVHGPIWLELHMFDKSTNIQKNQCKIGVRAIGTPTGTLGVILEKIVKKNK